MQRNKLGNVYLLDCEIDLDFMLHDYEGWHNQGTIIYKIGKFGKVKKAEYITMDNKRKIAFLEPRFKGYELPENKEDRENLLLMVYGKIGEMQYFIDLKRYFLEEEEKRKEEERKRKEIIKSLENVGNAMKNISETFEKALTSIAVSDIIKTMKGER